MKKDYYTWGKIERGCKEIADQLKKDGFVPDYIVGITRGGAIPAILLSNLLGVPMRPLEVSLRDSGITTSACDMAEDAFGYTEIGICDGIHKKKILIVDDINDTGNTLNWIKSDWEKSVFPGSAEWTDVWHKNVKFATVVNNAASSATVDYSSVLINKLVNPAWIVFPWEEF